MERGFVIFWGLVMFAFFGWIGWMSKQPVPKYPAKVRMIDGRVLSCKNHFRLHCGYTLNDCDDGNTYECATNLVFLEETKYE